MPVLEGSVVKFSIRPEKGRRDYYRVFIFPSKGVMLEFWRAQTELAPSLGQYGAFEAQCNGWKQEIRRGRTSKCRGQILFHVGNMRAGIVAHEMTHATRYYLGEDNLDDEGMAHIVGRMTAAFWRHFYKYHELKQ